MTKPQYLESSAAGSKVRGVAASPAANSPADYAWNVNFNNGNSNWNNHNNNGFVRAVRPSECHDAVSLRDLHAAWREARRGKRPSQNQLDFDTRWLDGLIDLQRRLNAGTWCPARPTCFVAKRLENARAGCGIPIGNLSSQFFANVYLDAVDQFVKHDLKAPRYLRYVDDFVLIHQSRKQLEAWQAAIATFLVERLHITLKQDVKLKPLQSGIDFLGYVVWSTHTVVRRRVVHHACEKLIDWERRHVRGRRIEASRSARAGLSSTWASYRGHFSHANSVRLHQRIERRFPWLIGYSK